MSVESICKFVPAEEVSGEKLLLSISEHQILTIDARVHRGKS